jgi:hypothetical protein
MDTWNQMEEPFMPMENDLDRILKIIFPQSADFLDAPHTWWEIFWYFRWVWNFAFIFCPWVLFSLFLVAMNITLNVIMNNDWAQGNVGLIFNTIYLLVQVGFSWPLLLELPIYMRTFRLFRICSFTWAMGYSAFYLYVILDWVYQIYWEPTKTYEQYQFIDILLNMYLAYNIVFNLHIMPVNLTIIFKEFSLMLWPPMLDQDLGDELDGEDFVDMVEPQTWWDWIIY